jgi:hypothetical protein
MSNILCKTKYVCGACGQERDSFNLGKKQGAVEVFDLIKQYHSPKSLGFKLWNKIETKIKVCEK